MTSAATARTDRPWGHFEDLREETDYKIKLIVVRPGHRLSLPRLAWHRLGNSGSEDLVLLELQMGEYFGEDDIERRADDYGRDAPAP